EDARHAPPDRDDLLRFLCGSEDPILQTLRDRRRRQRDPPPRGAQSVENAATASAPRHVALYGRARELVQLVVELIEQQGFELLAVHGLSVLGFGSKDKAGKRSNQSNDLAKRSCVVLVLGEALLEALERVA